MRPALPTNCAPSSATMRSPPIRRTRTRIKRGRLNPKGKSTGKWARRVTRTPRPPRRPIGLKAGLRIARGHPHLNLAPVSRFPIHRDAPASPISTRKVAPFRQIPTPRAARFHRLPLLKVTRLRQIPVSKAGHRIAPGRPRLPIAPVSRCLALRGAPSHRLKGAPFRPLPIREVAPFRHRIPNRKWDLKAAPFHRLPVNRAVLREGDRRKTPLLKIKARSRKK